MYLETDLWKKTWGYGGAEMPVRVSRDEINEKTKDPCSLKNLKRQLLKDKICT
jgi:hypothetical protein